MPCSSGFVIALFLFCCTAGSASVTCELGHSILVGTYRLAG